MIFVAVIAGIISSLLAQAQTILFVPVLNVLYDPDKENASIRVREISFFFLWIGLGMGGLTFIKNFCLQYTAQNQLHRLQRQYVRTALSQEISFYDMEKPSSLNSRLTDDAKTVHTGISINLGTAAESLTTAIFGLVVGFFFSWELALVMLFGIGPVLVVLMGQIGSVMGGLQKKMGERYALAGSIAEEAISAIKTVMSFNGQEKEVKRYETELHNAYMLGLKQGTKKGAFFGFFSFVMYAIYALGFWYGSLLVSRATPYLINTISAPTPDVGSIVVSFFSIFLAVAGLGAVMPAFTAISKAQGAAYHLYELIDRKPPINVLSESGLTPKEDSKSKGIEFRNVYFTYPSRPDVEILHDVSFNIKEGQSVALVGFTGSGKSTCISLLQRFYDVNKGAVLVNGNDIRELNINWLRTRMGSVGQEPILFNISIAENISHGCASANHDQIVEAARGANIHEFIETLPDKYDTLVGEGGTQLSGGQKQRVAIARALIRDPPILLLDEATSALDTESERIVQDALNKLMEGRTTIMIAHRLSTTKDADLILVFEKGHIVERGSHDELLQTTHGDNIYRSLVEKQEVKEENDDDGMNEQEALMFKRQSSDRGSTENIEKKDEVLSKKPMTKRLFNMVKPYRSWFIFGCLMAFFGSVSSPLQGALISAIINNLAYCVPFPLPGTNITVYGSNQFTVLSQCHSELKLVALKNAGIFILCGIFMAINTLFAVISFRHVGEGITFKLRVFLFKSIMRQEPEWFDMAEHSTGALSAKLAKDAALVRGFAVDGAFLYIQTIMTVVLTTVLSMTQGYEFALLLLPILPFFALGTYWEMKYLWYREAGDQDAYEKAGDIVYQALNGIRTVTSFSIQDDILELYNSRMKPATSTVLQKTLVSSLALGYTKFVQSFVSFYSYYIASYLLVGTFTREYTGEMIFNVVMITSQGFLGVGYALSNLADFTKAKMAARRVFVIMDTVPQNIDVGMKLEEDQVEIFRPSNVVNSGTILTKIQGDIELKNVRFRYPTRPNVKILRGVSLSIKSGQTVALVGQSGSGKSTILSLIERYYDPLRGYLTLDGVPIRDINVNCLRSHIGFVGQEPVLFASSILDNIRYSNEDATIKDVEHAALSANIADFIEQLPKRYDTPVGSKGNQLSGGQKQRIAIARAIIRKPSILLLDEATAALDAESEQLVQKALDKLMINRTTVVIAHRLSTIQDADKIIVMEKGKIIEIGAHQELLHLNGTYKKLCVQQHL